MEKEALLIVTDLKLAVEDINKISRLVSDNSHNQQFIREISNMRPQFMENIRAMLNVTTKQCVQGIVHPALCIVYFKILCHKIIQIFNLISEWKSLISYFGHFPLDFFCQLWTQDSLRHLLRHLITNFEICQLLVTPGPFE